MTLLPVKDKKIKVKNRYLNYFVFKYKNSVYIQKRMDKDIWQNLYEFYLIETPHVVTPDVILSHVDLLNVANEFEVISVDISKKHILSHQHLFATFYQLKIDKPLKSNTLLKIKPEDLVNYGLPQLINKYLQNKEL
jgi:A/G-specific adenine glycosylase